MTSIYRKLTVAFVMICWTLMFLALALYGCGARINTTRSIPVGLYWTTKDPIVTGAYVMFCPPEVEVFHEAKNRGYIDTGLCPGHYGYMMKQVMGTKNDTVNVTNEGVRVNNTLLPLSVPLNADSSGRALPRYQTNHYVLDDTQVLLMSDVNERSFDSRYFGPIRQSQIVTVIKPIITW